MSHPASEEVLSIPALGRPFRLGVLYDCRTEKIIPAITLWDTETLEHKTVQKLGTADFHLIASDSLEDKALALDVNASLKLSFLGGLLEISGSAGYLENRKSSNLQERVTLQYKCTTRSETLTMEQMGQGKIQHPQILDNGTATHVVTGIVYGGQAFFVFDREHSSSFQDKNVDGTLNVLVKNIPTMSIDGEGQLDLSEDDKKKTENFSCRFFGDFLPRVNPSSFKDAVKLYKEIPSHLGDDGINSVPVKVMLYPLTLLDSKASKLVREISTNLIYETEKIIEDFHELSVKCNDLCNSHAAKKFSAFREEISRFKKLIGIYKLEFQRKLSILLPRIRGGGTEESELAIVLRNKELSPFSQHALHHWIQSKEKQLKILTEYVNGFSDIKFVSQPGDLAATHLSLENDYTLCFAILIPKINSHLEKMAKYIDINDTTNDRITEEMHHKMPVMDSNSDERSMIEKARLFKNFFESNRDRKGTAFVVSEDFSDSEEFQAHIRFYKHGRLVDRDYALPSQPGMPEADTEESTHDSMTIHWTTPIYGVSNVQQYEILCQEIDDKSPVKFRTGSDSVKFTIPNLYANCTYQVSVQSCCEAGLGPSSNTNPGVLTKPTSPPAKPQAHQTSATSVTIQWSKPVCIGSKCSIENYVIEQQEESTDSWIVMRKTKSEELSCTIQVTPNTTHKFRIKAYCGTAGYSAASKISTIFVKANPIEILKEKLCATSTLLGAGHPSIYKLDLRLIYSSDNGMISKCEFGVNRNKTLEKVIMVVGATGSGKTTLINGLVNYVFGVKWKDSFRFKMISEPTDKNQAKSQTTKITSYTIHHQEGFKVPYTLTIIDTPGFGDTSGVMRDREITQEIRKFFSTEGTCGVDHIDAVGFLAQSSLPRLTPTQTYIFDQILSLFGKDIEDNIFLLLTFADGQKPQVLSGIKEAGITYQKYFKFNNSALFVNNSSTDDSNGDGDGSDSEEIFNFDALFWKMGEKNYKMFLTQLNLVESKSLVLTKNVLMERHQLQVYIAGIQKDIQSGLTYLEQLREEVKVMKNHQADIDKNKDFKYTVNQEITEQVKIPHSQHITNCLKCNRTCHEVCGISEDSGKRNCYAITEDNCRICPNKCHWTHHKNFPYKYVLKMVTVTKTSQELLERYQKATKDKLSAKQAIESISDEFQAMRLKVLGMTELVRKSLQRLQEIALKPNPLSTVEYIDIMVESEESQAQPGWQARVEQLRNVRKEAEYMQDIANKGFDPFTEYKKKMEEEKRLNKKGFWSQAGEFLENIFK